MHLKSGNRDTGMEKKCMDTKGERGGENKQEIGFDVYALWILGIKQITNENTMYSTGTLLNALW